MKRVLLAHGGGGEETRQLISEVFQKLLSNPVLNSLEDAALLTIPDTKLAFTTDSFTVVPAFFKGGDIGKLAVAGTVNDLSVTGAKPLYLSSGFIIEEGFPYEDLISIVESMRHEAAHSGVLVVTGDTKVLPKGDLNGILINTSGIGEVKYAGLSAANLEAGDIIIVSGTVGDHGACILAAREDFDFELEISSDCRSLWPLLEKVLDAGACIHAMRDPTRGGLAATLIEWVEASGVEVEINEEDVPVSGAVSGISELLGMEPAHLASEGRVVMAVKRDDAERVLEVLLADPAGRGARIIGEVTKGGDARVILRSSYGTRRIMEPPHGELLPRIC